jgi:sporulation protein YlmC with PRC-barrel domain
VKEKMKFQELLDKDVFVEGGLKIGKVKDVIIDNEEWKITHLEIELNKWAAENILGATVGLTKSVRNTLAISALKKGTACCTSDGVDIKVSKAQLHIYLRPA